MNSHVALLHITSMVKFIIKLGKGYYEAKSIETLLLNNKTILFVYTHTNVFVIYSSFQANFQASLHGVKCFII